MIKEFELFRGHKRFKEIHHLQSIIQLKAAVARHVSAKGLTTLVSPKSLHDHQRLTSADKQIWDDAYLEELQGLKDKKTWDTITEEEFRRI